MECIINVYLLNDHFSIEHANAHHDGKPSENNPLYEWEDEFKITTEVKEVLVKEKDTYVLQGELNNQAFSYEIPNMRLFYIHSDNAPVTVIGCSESILDKAELIEKDKQFNIVLTLKDFEPMANPIPGLYIAAQEFPKELIF
jgi:hypothetical protein